MANVLQELVQAAPDDGVVSELSAADELAIKAVQTALLGLQ